MSLLNRFHNGCQLFLLGLVYCIMQILTDDRSVRRDLHNIHSIDLAEFLFLCKSRTGHTCLFVKFIKEVLEGDGCKSLALPLYLHMLLGLDGLMKSVGIASSRHDTSGKLIHDQYLVVLYHIILIPEHQIVGAQRQNNIMLDLNIFRIGKVLDLEEFLYLLNTLCRQIYDLVLLIYNKVTGLFSFHAHNGVHFGKILHILAALHLLGKHVTHFVKLRGFSTLAGNDKRRSGFIDQDGVHLVNDGVMKIPQYKLRLVNYHVVTQIIKTKLIVGHIGNVTGISLPALLCLHAV